MPSPNCFCVYKHNVHQNTQFLKFLRTIALQGNPLFLPCAGCKRPGCDTPVLKPKDTSKLADQNTITYVRTLPSPAMYAVFSVLIEKFHKHPKKYIHIRTYVPRSVALFLTSTKDVGIKWYNFGFQVSDIQGSHPWSIKLSKYNEVWML